jgi:hypothetical protein
MRRAILLGLLFLVAAVGTAAADVWDSRGWTMLGERSVNGRVDRDRIDVGRYEGRFNKLTLVVLDSDLELLEFEINFQDRTKYNPRLSYYFRENARTKVIDLPPGESIIHHIDLKYRNLRGGGNARIQVWGFRTGGGAPPPPPPQQFTWDNRGWTMLGERTVNGRVDRDRIPVGRYEGRFSKLTIVVLDSDLELLSFQVNFPRGNAYAPRVNHYFRENQRTRVIDLPGDDRSIRDIDITYRNLPGGGSARVQVWGFKTTGNAAPPPPVQFTWDSRGWRLIGEQTVAGRVDRDRINVTYDEGKFRQLMIVVLDSDLELLDFDVTFADNTRWSPNARQYFRENTRTRSIDLPGNRRRIRHIDVKYKNLPGGGNARFQVWGK